MSIPRYCSSCGDFVGSESTAHILARVQAGRAGQSDSSVNLSCPGQGNHPQPEVRQYERFFGLLKRTSVVYPETLDVETSDEYLGPPSKFLLWFAIVFGTAPRQNGSHDGLSVKGKWVWWDSKIGFYGDGKDVLWPKKA